MFTKINLKTTSLHSIIIVCTIALHLACDIGAEDCINNLINQGANPNLLDKANRTPLMSICNNGNAICVGPVSDMNSN